MTRSSWWGKACESLTEVRKLCINSVVGRKRLNAAEFTLLFR